MKIRVPKHAWHSPPQLLTMNLSSLKPKTLESPLTPFFLISHIWFICKPYQLCLQNVSSILSLFTTMDWAIITPCRDNCSKLLISLLASNSVSQHSSWIQPSGLYFYLLNQITSLFSESSNGFPSHSERRLRDLYTVSLLPALVPRHTLPYSDISWTLSPPALQLGYCSSNTGLSKANLCLKYCTPAEPSIQNILLASIYPAQFLKISAQMSSIKWGFPWPLCQNAPSPDTPMSILTLCSRLHCGL